jgi:omega-hydroxy-beta-dihydromenaquinone-9 sulfotransferase
MRWIDYPVIGPKLIRKYRSWECYDYWNSLFPGFAEPYRDLFASDVTPRTKSRVRAAMNTLLTEKRNRLLVKITGWPRIGFLSEILPDARFLHILRDGRAVANSNLEVDFWNGWAGPDLWRFGKLTDDERRLWESTGESFVALAGIEWNKLMDAMEHARNLVGEDRFLEVKYEELCDDTLGKSRLIADFFELEWTPEFERVVRNSEFKNQNAKWRKNLTTDQQRVLDHVVYDRVRKYGYLDRDDSRLEIVNYTR